MSAHDRLAQLAADAAAGLTADGELYRDVTRELRTHLEEAAAAHARQGHDEAASIDHAVNTFGSPLDLAADLQAANRPRMRLRAALRLALQALLIPLAILLALYVGYGRFARQQRVSQLYYSFGDTTYPSAQLPMLPFFSLNDAAPAASAPTRPLFSHNPAELRRCWEQHRNDPDARAYYAHYILLSHQQTNLFETPMPEFDAPLQEDIRRGERIDPDNALYTVLLAVQYLNNGMTAQAEQRKSKHGAPRTDALLNRQAFERGLAELHRLPQKTYLRDYQLRILRLKLNALPPPALTEDYLAQQAVAAGIVFPQFVYYRTLARKIPGCARLLIAQGRAREAEAVMDTWKPLVRMMTAEDSATLIHAMVAQACAAILTNEGRQVYRQLGATAKAREADAAYQRLAAIRQGWTARQSNLSPTQVAEFNRAVSLMGKQLYPIFGAQRYLAIDELRPGRMYEHVMFEQAAAQLVLVFLALALCGAVLSGMVWLYRLRRAPAVPLLLMPPARELLRAVGWGIVLPVILYALYTRCPLLGGREYGLASLWPRFLAEWLIMMGIMLWLPAHRMQRYLIQRCAILGIPVPDKREARRINLRTRGGIVAAALLMLVLTATPWGDISDSVFFAKGAGLVLAAVLIAVLVYIANKWRQAHGLYYGTLARSMSLIYACAILTLALAVQPWLLCQEAYWLKQDKLMFGYLADRTAPTAGFSLPEARAAADYNNMVRNALVPQPAPGGSHAE